MSETYRTWLHKSTTATTTVTATIAKATTPNSQTHTKDRANQLGQLFGARNPKLLALISAESYCSGSRRVCEEGRGGTGKEGKYME